MAMNQIRTARKAAGLTMKQLGAAIGVSESTVSLYENGKHQPDNDMLLRIAECLNVTVDYLLGRESRDVLSPIETELLSIFRRLNADGQQSLMTYARERLELPSMTEREQMLA